VALSWLASALLVLTECLVYWLVLPPTCLLCQAKPWNDASCHSVWARFGHESFRRRPGDMSPEGEGHAGAAGAHSIPNASQARTHLDSSEPNEQFVVVRLTGRMASNGGNGGGCAMDVP
jgi:hypothetical protein